MYLEIFIQSEVTDLNKIHYYLIFKLKNSYSTLNSTIEYIFLQLSEAKTDKL